MQIEHGVGQSNATIRQRNEWAFKVLELTIPKALSGSPPEWWGGSKSATQSIQKKNQSTLIKSVASNHNTMDKYHSHILFSTCYTNSQRNGSGLD